MFKVGDIIKDKLSYSIINAPKYEVIGVISNNSMNIRYINGDIYPLNPVQVKCFELNLKEMRKQKLLKLYQH